MKTIIKEQQDYIKRLETIIELWIKYMRDMLDKQQTSLKDFRIKES